MEKKKIIKVFVKNPGKAPHMEVIQNTLGTLQRIVGGNIEAVTLSTDAALIVNEEGRLYNLPYNCEYLGTWFVGTMVWVGVDGEEFTDFPMTKEEFKALNPKLWEVSK